jgi:hypothetical protein
MAISSIVHPTKSSSLVLGMSASVADPASFYPVPDSVANLTVTGILFLLVPPCQIDPYPPTP